MAPELFLNAPQESFLRSTRHSRAETRIYLTDDPKQTQEDLDAEWLKNHPWIDPHASYLTGFHYGIPGLPLQSKSIPKRRRTLSDVSGDTHNVTGSRMDSSEESHAYKQAHREAASEEAQRKKRHRVKLSSNESKSTGLLTTLRKKDTPTNIVGIEGPIKDFSVLDSSALVRKSEVPGQGPDLADESDSDSDSRSDILDMISKIGAKRIEDEATRFKAKYDEEASWPRPAPTISRHLEADRPSKSADELALVRVSSPDITTPGASTAQGNSTASAASSATKELIPKRVGSTETLGSGSLGDDERTSTDNADSEAVESSELEDGTFGKDELKRGTSSESEDLHSLRSDEREGQKHSEL